MTTLKSLTLFAIEFLRFAVEANPPKEKNPYRCPSTVDMASTQTDPRTGVEVMITFRDGRWDFYMHQVDSLIRAPKVPEQVKSLVSS